GTSGTTYLYIHLNNDRTLKNDNAGGCSSEHTYTVGDRSKVAAGQQIAWSGDSGDADGNPHLHFEVHPNDGEAISPFATLQAAVRTLFPARVGSAAAVAFRGAITVSSGDTIAIEAAAVRWWPGGKWLEIEPRTIELARDGTTVVDPGLKGALQPTATSGSSEVTIFTRVGKATPEAIAALPGALVAARVRPVA
ncbi:MAG: M23 family metallopeptidase, partial [Deltaproteobacteria bacterium]|nr:M23 family metallopeptidase [Deltaproteobacteria bacterium]